ncbi:MAG: TonB-dependent receptor [Bacteroidota bacterium]
MKSNYFYFLDNSRIKKIVRVIQISFVLSAVVLMQVSAKNYHIESTVNGDNIELKESFVVSNLALDIAITGTITDETGASIPGVSIVEKGTTNGTVSDADGKYNLNVSEGATLVFSFVGYETQEVAVGNATEINITLAASTEILSEIIVVGYGTVQKSDLTGSVSSISEEDFNLGGSVTTPEGLIQGRAAGVQVSTVSAAPGAEPVIRIRGNNSLLGKNTPLYVVDGMQMDGLDNMINVEDIASMEILKDASATAIYGTRGANGVVIISTKRGSKGITSIDYSFEQTFDQVANLDAYDFLNATEYAEGRNYQTSLVAGSTPIYNDAALAIIKAKGDGTDWLDEMFHTGSVQKHNISLGVNNDKTSVFVSAHMMDQEGVVPNTGFKKITSRLNLDQKVIEDRLSVSVSSLISNTTLDALGFNGGNGQSNIFRNVFKGNPIVPVTWDGWTDAERQTVFANNKPVNPLEIMNNDDYLETRLGVTTSAAATVNIVDGLTYTARIGIKYLNTKMRHFLPQINGLVATDIPMGSAVIGNSIYTNRLMESILRYTKEFGKHNIEALGVYSQNPRMWEGFTAAAQDFVSDNLSYNNLGAGATILAPSSSIAESNLISYVARAEYGYDNKYNVTASVRRDGSSKFGENNKWAIFPSVAVGWKVHNEGFFNVSPISHLKLRGSWGVTGNDGIGIGSAQAVFAAGLPISLDSDDLRKGIASAKLGNPDLKWETTTAYNMGIEFGLVEDRIGIEFDIYKKLTNDLLWQKPVSSTLGFTTQIDNIGTVENKGFEVLLNTVNISNDDLRWTSTFTFAQNLNQIKELELPEGAEFFPAPPVNHWIYPSVLMVGESLGAFYGYRSRGVLQEGEVDPLQPGALPGDLLFEDLNGDGVVSAAGDKEILGQGIPKFTFGFNNSISYKNFQLSFFFQGAAGSDIINMNKIIGYDNGTLRSSTEDRWRSDNTEGTNYQRSWDWTYEFPIADTDLESANFLTLKNLRFAYSVPTKDLGMSWVRDLTLSFTGQNLLVFTNYSGFYPEVNSTNGGGFEASIAGVDSYAYPMTKSYSFGVNIGF